jgi:hypothetical protein
MKKHTCQWHEGCDKKAITFLGHRYLCQKHARELVKRLKEIIKEAWRP